MTALLLSFVRCRISALMTLASQSALSYDWTRSILYGSRMMMGRWTMPSPLYIILSSRQTVMRNKSCWRSRNPGRGRWRFIEQNRGEWGRDVTVGATVDDVSLLYQRQFPACNEDPVVPICRYYLIATITCSDSIDCAPASSYSNSLTATIASRKSLQLHELGVHTGYSWRTSSKPTEAAVLCGPRDGLTRSDSGRKQPTNDTIRKRAVKCQASR